MKRLSQSEFTHFISEVSSLLRAGISLPEGINQYSQNVRKVKCSNFSKEVGEYIHMGYTLSQALRKSGYVISESRIAAIECAELSGNLGEVLRFLNEHEGLMANNRYLLNSVLIYPTLLFIVGYIALWLISTFGISAYINSLDSIRVTEMHWVMEKCVGFASIIDGWSGVCILLSFLTFLLLLFSFEKVRAWFWNGILKFPIISLVFIVGDTAVMTRYLGEMLKYGVPLAKGLDVVKQAVITPVVKQDITRMIDANEKGNSICRFLDKEVPATAVFLIHQAEGNGDLSEALLDASHLCEERYIESSQAMLNWLEPLFILTVGLWISCPVIALLSPFFHLAHHVAPMMR